MSEAPREPRSDDVGPDTRAPLRRRMQVVASRLVGGDNAIAEANKHAQEKAREAADAVEQARAGLPPRVAGVEEANKLWDDVANQTDKAAKVGGVTLGILTREDAGLPAAVEAGTKFVEGWKPGSDVREARLDGAARWELGKVPTMNGPTEVAGAPTEAPAPVDQGPAAPSA